MPREGGYITVRQAAETVRLSRHLLYEAIAAGELPHVVIGGVKHVDADVFNAWCEERRSVEQG
ncbi:MAG TPA: helix-turn-helix domain-containing protein [Acidimicrobiales bacterium]|nr:helix-turn-helix domain-containing protein [Acidimicrobiales bacterium]